jgi:hypothetical protein
MSQSLKEKEDERLALGEGPSEEEEIESGR